MRHEPAWLSYAVPLVVIAVVLALRWRRMSRPQPLRLERLWIFPALYLAVAAALFVAHPPRPLGWAAAVVALGLGAALGWQRGKLMRIEVDPVTHELNQRGSPAAMLLLVVVVLARLGARRVAEGGGFQIDPLAVADVLLAFAFGLIGMTRLEMYLRARRMLSAVQARA